MAFTPAQQRPLEPRPGGPEPTRLNFHEAAPPRRPPLIAAVIVNYHGAAMTARAARSALASRGVRSKVIIIDNEFDPELAAAMGDLSNDPRVELIRNAANAGFGAACNQGIDRALLGGECDGALLLNNDAELAEDALALLSEAARQTGLAAPKILLPDGRLYSAGGIVELPRARCRNRGIYETDRGQHDQAGAVPFASACALLISATALRSGIRFHEPYFLYYEDADFCLRLARAGFTIRYCPGARVTHLESASSTGAGRAARLLYYDLRNRFLFTRRNASGLARLRAQVYLGATALIRWLKFKLARRASLAGAVARAARDAWRGRFGPMAETPPATKKTRA